MRPEGRDAAQLWDMLRFSRTVARLVVGKSFADYERDETLRLAVERAIEIVGEAARGVSAPFQAAHPEVPWRPIVAQRHVLAHEYGDVVNEKIWRVASVHIPALIGVLEPLVPPSPPPS